MFSMAKPAKAPAIDALLKEIRAACEEHADVARAARYARYFVEGYDAFGVDWKSPAWEARREGWLETCQSRGLDWLLDLGDALVRTGKYEEASLAITMAAAFRSEFTPGSFARLGRWFEGGIRNWGHTDVLCGELLGRLLCDGVVDLEALAPWRASAWKYQRRAVPVMLISLLGQSKDVAPLLDAVRPLMGDAEKVVHQGLGWFLREAWKRQPKPVEAFLMEHRQTAPRLIFQYATEKMTPEQRARFKRPKS